MPFADMLIFRIRSVVMVTVFPMVDHTGAIVDGDELLAIIVRGCLGAVNCKAVWSVP